MDNRIDIHIHVHHDGQIQQDRIERKVDSILAVVTTPGLDLSKLHEAVKNLEAKGSQLQAADAAASAPSSPQSPAKV